MKVATLTYQPPKSFTDRVIAGNFATPVIGSSIIFGSLAFAARAAFFDVRDIKKLRNRDVVLRNFRNLTFKRASAAMFLGIYTGGSLLHFGFQVSVLGVSKYFNKKV